MWEEPSLSFKFKIVVCIIHSHFSFAKFHKADLKAAVDDETFGSLEKEFQQVRKSA